MKIVETRTAAQKPKGAPFIIDSCPFRFGKQIDTAVLDLEESKVQSWPMVYILANKKFAYVGQTTSVATRIGQHCTSVEKKDFTRVNIIYNEEFNTSAITDYEHRLIGYMNADQRYTLTNKNEGMSDTNYFSKTQYTDMFKDLWEELRRLELAEHTIHEIEESEVFKYSPYKGLSVDQRVALERILAAIDGDLDRAEPIVVEGMPGTGKTILAIYLLKALRDNPKYEGLNIRILEPVTSLRKTLQKTLRVVNGLKSSDIIGASDLVKPEYGYVSGEKKCFDILLVDEAHRLKQRVNIVNYSSYDETNRKLGLPASATQIDWIIDQAKLPIFFYDPMQTVGPSCLGEDTIHSTLGPAVENPIKLDSQMRVKGGKGYLDYVASILADEDPKPKEFNGYDLVLHDDFKTFIDSFERYYEKHDLTRMIAGYSWEWKTKGNPDPALFDIAIDGITLRWNRTSDNWVGKGFNNPTIAHEVGCIHSIQGYDLSCAFVIIGEDIRLNPQTGLFEADKDNYYDANGKRTASDEELTQYIKSIYYVLLTRGIYGTHIYVCNPELRKYLSEYFPLVKRYR
ncbi:MAG: DUF2075 domain-containing protein [Coriobacteriia bacterium]|nr:DUF2075 domain-containing protein [Coriobacteriia bacterium]